MTYELFEHTADVGLRVRSPSIDQLFAEAAEGLFSMVVPNLQTVKPLFEKRVSLSEEDYEYLLFDWLNQLLFIFETEHFVLVEFSVKIAGYTIVAVCHGEPLSMERHETGMEVKAITYHGLKVSREDGSWLAEVIVDI